MGISATAMTLISTAVGVGSAMMQGKAASQQAKYQAQIANQQAERARQMGELQARNQRKKSKALEASQRALIASRGGDPSTGSALLVGTELAAENELNARLLENNAAAQQTALQNEAELQRARARNATSSSFFRAGTSLLKGGSALQGQGFFDRTSSNYMKVF
jgi:hypothetical protein